ncbi:hypothetical protein GCM10010995_08280 [Cysteiniphilum litorale]|uniref:Uncharacterized protein n=2 Tax=Fastidiosibacteraceae TaxID=2056687 RepID=A0A8J2Z377_9GAMM|nr:hypothetical protein GCM10010995_08280 [Cysteiniphilum litorale]
MPHVRGTQVVNLRNAPEVLPFEHETHMQIEISGISNIAQAAVMSPWHYQVIGSDDLVQVKKTNSGLAIKNINTSGEDRNVKINILVNNAVLETLTVTLLTDKPYTYMLRSQGNYFLIVDPLHSDSREESLEQSLYLAVASSLLQRDHSTELDVAVKKEITHFDTFSDFDYRTSRIEKHKLIKSLYTNAGFDITDVTNIPTFADRYGLPYKQLEFTGVPSQVIGAAEVVNSPDLTVTATRDDNNPEFVLGDMAGKFVLVQSKNNTGNILKEVIERYLSSSYTPSTPGDSTAPSVSSNFSAPSNPNVPSS